MAMRIYSVQPKKHREGYPGTTCEGYALAEHLRLYWQRLTGFEWVITIKETNG